MHCRAGKERRSRSKADGHQGHEENGDQPLLKILGYLVKRHLSPGTSRVLDLSAVHRIYEAHHPLLRPSSRARSHRYNGTCLTYNGAMSTSEHIMTVSQNGQVSIPAAARARWNVRRVIVVDLGDRVVVRPASDRPVAALEGKYKGQGPSSDQARRRARQAETSRAR